MNRYMIDFETFGNSKNACVVQIGACSFDLTRQLKLNIDPASSVANGGIIDADTVCWWLAQSSEARESIVANPQFQEKESFESLNYFLSTADEIWSHSTFDFVIMMEAMRRLRIPPSFSYRAARDIRTLQALANDKTKYVRSGVHHDALADCLFQVEYCKGALAILGVE